MRACVPLVPPLFSCTALLYSLALITPDYSVANRQVVQVASDWLANLVQPILACPVQLFQFWFGAHVRPSRQGFDWRAQFGVPQSDWSDFWCSDRGLLLG